MCIILTYSDTLYNTSLTLTVHKRFISWHHTHNVQFGEHSMRALNAMPAEMGSVVCPIHCTFLAGYGVNLLLCRTLPRSEGAGDTDLEREADTGVLECN